MRKLLPFVFALIVVAFVFAACNSSRYAGRNLKSGTFHFYTPEQVHFLILKKDTLNAEVNIQTGDTSYWHVQWLDDSTYNSTFIRKTNPDTGMRQQFNLEAKTQIHIKAVRPAYYLFESLSTYKDKTYTYADTVWFQPK
ncbi:MAG: hypothetical protein EOO10_19520 [Chitinophagaceae bacterium]|nr:MAG: hypothetical protein EOO10_19520 [Chitinophagaceae bacterium]